LPAALVALRALFAYGVIRFAVICLRRYFALRALFSFAVICLRRYLFHVIFTA
jgi:hypothetical protein